MLSVFGGSSIKASNYIQDAKENGYKVTPPDINLSQHEYSIVSDKEILYGFDTIKGLSKKAIDEIMLKRPFTSIPDMVERTVKGQLDKRAIKVLVLSGALDSISNGIGNRMEVFQIILNLRGTGGEELQEDVDGFTKRRLLDYEKELLGVYISGHPLENIAKPIDWEEAYESGQSIQGHALIKEIRRIITKKGDPMAFLMLEFMEQDVSAVCFPNTYNEPYEFRKGDPLVPLSQLLKENTVVKVSGRYEDNNRGEPNLVLNRLDVPVRANEDRKSEIKTLQEEIGTQQVVKEKPQAPVFSSDSLF